MSLTDAQIDTLARALENAEITYFKDGGDYWHYFAECFEDISGGLSGEGDEGQVTYWDAGNVLTGNDNLYWDDTLGQFKIGGIASPTFQVIGLALGATPVGKLCVDANGNLVRIRSVAYSFPDVGAEGFLFRDDEGNITFEVGDLHTLLDGSIHTDTLAYAVTRGALIYGSATGWNGLNISPNEGYVLKVVTVGVGLYEPAWGQVDWDEIDNIPSTFNPSVHGLLDDDYHSPVLDYSITQGALIYGSGASPNTKWNGLAISANANYVLKVGSLGGGKYEPTWGQVGWTELTGVPSTFPPDTHDSSKHTVGGTPSKTTPLALSTDGTDDKVPHIDHYHQSPGGVASIVSFVRIANSNTETQLIGVTIPAGMLAQYTTLRIIADGNASTASSAGNMTWNVRVGQSTLTGNIASTMTITPTNGLSAKGWHVDFTITIMTSGAGGTVIGNGFNVNELSTTLPNYVKLTANTSTVAVDTTKNRIVELNFKWATRDVANDLRCDNAIIIMSMM